MDDVPTNLLLEKSRGPNAFANSIRILDNENENRVCRSPLGSEGESVEDHPYYNAIDAGESDIENGEEAKLIVQTEDLVVAVAIKPKKHHPIMIAMMLSVAAAYGAIIGTFFLLTLPMECSRMSVDGSVKSINLGIFIFVAGLTQLASPIIGLASDSLNKSGRVGIHHHALGRRRPFLILGYFMCSVGFIGMSRCSTSEFWVFYGLFYTLTMLALNVVYSALIALIPDLISIEQTGMANGIFAMLVVLGSLLGFLTFSYMLNTHENLKDVYVFYNAFLATTLVLCLGTACEEEFTSCLTGCDVESDDNVSRAVVDEKSTLLKKASKWPPSTWSLLCSKHLPSTLLTSVSVSVSAFTTITWPQIHDAYRLDPEVHHDFFVVTVSRGFYYMGVSVQTFLMYFLHDIIHDVTDPQEAVALISVIGFASGACTAFPVGYLSDRLGNGRKPYVYASCVLLAGGTLALLACQRFHQVLILSAIVGCANGAYLAMDTSLAVDTLPNKNDAAKFLGIWGVAGFVGSAMGPMLGGPILYVLGSFPYGSNATDDEQSYSIVGYAALFSLSAIYFACSAISLRWVENSH